MSIPNTRVRRYSGNALLGKGNISDLGSSRFARTPKERGIVLALDKATGACADVPMEKYTWSSPVAVYVKTATLTRRLRGSDTAKSLPVGRQNRYETATFDAEKKIEASPAVYGN
jgi:hypothetical protein